MTPELDKYYTNRLSMCGETAWKDLMDDIREMRKSTDTVSGIADERALFIKQGEIRMMDWFLSIAEISEQAYNQLKEENETAT